MDGVKGSHSNPQLVTKVESGDDDFKIRGAASSATSNEATAKDITPDTCTICLQTITERAVAVPCNHLTFDYLCLVSWLQERATCPLCKAVVREVQYDFGGPTDYKTYSLPARPPEKGRSVVGRSTRERGERQRASGWARREGNTQTADPTVERRRRVYRDRTYSKHVGANPTSQHRDFTPSSFALSESLQSRARAFLRRELQVFSFLDHGESVHRGGGRHYLVEYIVAVLKTHELKSASGQAEELVAEFLGEGNARLLLHELEAWLRSPFVRLEEWDRGVQYASLGLSGKA
ncbi:hypothetical protein LTR86_006573 [Recurvomyces mirabilis]|nr:hypothetical protein LTR86_006573 [Recurvomyces mirabilis]